MELIVHDGFRLFPSCSKIISQPTPIFSLLQIEKLEIRILSLQNANKLSCGRCKEYRMNFNKIIKKLSILSNQHKRKLEEITTIK